MINNDTSTGPLPGGDRRGTSGAGAGRGSMRTASGSLLNRRARVGETEGTTAELIWDSDDTLQSGASPTSSAGTSEQDTTSSHTNNEDERRKWSDEEVRELMFCYFKTKAQGSGYIRRLEKLFKERNPTNPKASKFTGNTLSNQARCVIKKNTLPEQELELIKQQAEEINSQTDTQQTDTRTEPETRNIEQTSPGSNRSTIDRNAKNKWSDDEIKELMWCYFKAKSEGAGYIKRLERLFKERNPTNPKIHKFNGNTLSNQVRVILSRKALSDLVLDEIRKQAQENSEPTHVIPQSPTPSTRTDTQSPINVNITPEHTPIQTRISNTNTSENSLPHITDSTDIEVNEETDPLILTFLQVLAETKESSIEDRKYLPKPTFCKQFYSNLQKLNEYLPIVLATNSSLREVNDIIYATAKTLILTNNQKPYHPTNTAKKNREPPWKRRIKKKIEVLRKELGRFTEIKRGVTSRKMNKLKDKLYEKYNIFNEQDHDNTAETIKQRIKAYAGRIKRYEDMSNRKAQNKLFHENQHKFYRNLDRKTEPPERIPNKDEIEGFWSSILSQPIPYNRQAPWISEISQANANIQQSDFEEISIDMVKAAIRKTHNWKAPGIDKIQNYYLKYLTNTHEHLTKLYNNILKGAEEIEDWFTTGKVILIPKSEETQNPKNWRPIACLPTMYKLLTSVIANELYRHCESNNIIAPEQRGCRRRARGCKDHLMINKSILEDAHTSKKNLSTAWVDYRKAFDSVSHEWLLKVLDLYECPDAVKSFLLMVMPKWRVVMTAQGAHDTVETDHIYIRRGIFQGDSLSPLLFCLAINPLSQILNKYDTKGYRLKDRTTVNHLLYMDDLKVYAKTKEGLKVLLDSTEIFTKDIGMSFGLDKCNTLHITAGRRKSHQGEGHVLLSGEEFTHLGIGQSYKYLGINEAGKIEHNEIRQQTEKEYFKRVKKLLNSHLNSRNLIKAINIYAVPVLLYTFGIINYKQSDLKKIDTKTRKLLAMNKAHQQKAEVERLYLPLEEGGRGLTNVEMLHKTQIIKYKEYLDQETDYIIKATVEHDKTKDKYSIYKDSQENLQELQLDSQNRYTDKEIKSAVIKKRVNTWKEKPLHGQFCKAVLQKDNIDRELSFRWLKKQPVSSTLEASIFAIQDQAVITRQHERDILRKEIDGRCRLCATKDETIQHITSGCDKLAGTYYTKRHNNVVQYVHWSLLKKHNLHSTDLWWKEDLTQPQVKENEEAKVMWEMPVQTDVTVTHNRPDIIYTDKAENKTYLIDITIPSDYNIGAKEIEKLSKYHLLKKEIARLWNTDTQIIPIVIGATGIVAKSLHRYCNKLEAKINIHIMQKQAAIHTSTIVSKVLGDSVFVHGDTDAPLL